jgi:hypothetical protein
MEQAKRKADLATKNNVAHEQKEPLKNKDFFRFWSRRKK